MDPSVWWERVERVGDIDACAGLGVLMRTWVGVATGMEMEVKVGVYGAVCVMYPKPDVGEGIPLLSDATSAWRVRLCACVCANAAETVEPDLHLRSH